MIEIDIFTKHAKKALGLSEHTAKHTWRQRLPEILLEIGIIVFAITLSIELHAWNERVVGRAEEREFLLGLKTDLQADLRELSQDSLGYVQRHIIYHTLTRITPHSANRDSLQYAHQVLYGTINLVPNNSRYEGFKSAGKLGLIHDDKLLNMILDLYQERIPILLMATQAYSAFTLTQLQPYLDEHLDEADTNLLPLLATARMQRYMHREEQTQGEIYKYHEVLQQCRAIIREIDKTQ
jgi:hypothetical protein